MFACCLRVPSSESSRPCLSVLRRWHRALASRRCHVVLALPLRAVPLSMLKLRAYHCRCSARCRVRLALLPLRLSAAAYPGFLRKPGRCSPCSPYLTVSPGSTSALCCLRTAMAGPFPFSARASSRRCPSFNCCDRAKDGNGHRIPAYPRISNPAGADTGDRVHPRARVRAEF